MTLPPIDRPGTVRELDRVPSLMALYAKALTPDPADVARLGARILPDALRPKQRPATIDDRHRSLPDVALKVRGVTANPQELREYQNLLGFPRTEDLPAGYVHVLAFPAAMAVMAAPDFPLPLAGMVHLENRVDVDRTLTVGETFTVTAWASNLSGHLKGTRVDLIVEVSDPEGVVWRGVSTYLAKGTYTHGRGNDTGAAREFTPPLPTGSWKLGAGIGREYAAVSGDRNPIHLSALTAKAFGFPRAIAHGMYTAARALADARPLHGERYSWTVEFAKPVLLPEKVAVAITPHNAGGASYVGWNSKTGKLHFSGEISPL